MGYWNSATNKIHISECAVDCICKQLRGHENDCKVMFAGQSKEHNYGVQYNQFFYMERLAESWDADIHDYKTTIDRTDILQKGDILKKLANMHHPNLLQIIDYCGCSVKVEYIEGWLLNAKKQNWLLGPRSNETDYADICSQKDMLDLFITIGQVLQFLHMNGICHTDPIDHNVLIRYDRKVFLIDLLGCMPLTEQLLKLDKYVFLNKLIFPMAERMRIPLPKAIQDKALSGGSYEIQDLIADLKSIC